MEIEFLTNPFRFHLKWVTGLLQAFGLAVSVFSILPAFRVPFLFIPMTVCGLVGAWVYAQISWQWEYLDTVHVDPYSKQEHRVGDHQENLSHDRVKWLAGTFFVTFYPLWIHFLGVENTVLREMLRDGVASLTILAILTSWVLVGRRSNLFYLNLPPLLTVPDRVACRCVSPSTDGCPRHSPFEPPYYDDQFRSGWFTIIWNFCMGKWFLVDPRCASCE